MSPEQIQGTDEIDKRTDVYALAAMTFELLCGRPPFLGQSNFEVLHAHRYLDVPDASTLNPAVTKQVAKAIANAMSKKREDRPLSASEFSADLEAFFGLQEKVDPAVAFAFLEEDLRAEEERKARAKQAKAMRAATVPMARSPASGAARVTAPNLPLQKSPSSGEVPMARSSDVHLLTGSPTGPIAVPSKHLADSGPDDTQAGGEASGEHPLMASDTGVERSASDTNDDGADEEGDPNEDRSHTDPGAADDDDPDEREPPGEKEDDAGATVTESGELRVITTLKGLTTPATVFIDGRKHGTTPMSVQMPAGKHQVRVERQGFKSQEKSAVVTGGQVSLVRIELGAPAK
jgi:serine/threonine-protein kinase